MPIYKLCHHTCQITVGSALYTIDTDDSVIIPAAEEKREAVSDTSDTNTLSGSISKKNVSTSRQHNLMIPFEHKTTHAAHVTCMKCYDV